MKIEQLIESLQEIQKEFPAITVGVLSDNGVVSTCQVGVYAGEFHDKELTNKLMYQVDKRRYIAIGNPGNYTRTVFYDFCEPVKIIERFEK